MYRRTELDDKPWDDDSISRFALRRLVCHLCNAGAPDEEAMTRHLNGGPHLRELQRYREDWCRRNAEFGCASEETFKTEKDSRVMPPMHDVQKDWRERYTKGAKGTKQEVIDIQALPTDKRKAPAFKDKHYDNGQYNSNGLYCDICDVKVMSRNIMESHLSGKEHLRRMKPQKQFKCDICLVYVSSEETLQSHLKGNSHLRKLKQVKEQKEARKRQRVDPSEGELEELYMLREEKARLLVQVETLQGQLRRLNKLHNDCQLNHGKGKK